MNWRYSVSHASECNTSILPSEDTPQAIQLALHLLALLLGFLGPLSELIERANGAVEEATASSFVLGRMRAAEYRDAAVTLAPDDAIVFYTDGVIEAEGFSSERLEACVARGGSSREIADGIVSELPKENEDDVTMVVVRLSPRA